LQEDEEDLLVWKEYFLRTKVLLHLTKKLHNYVTK
jgi:hypothetical protein